MIRILAFLMVVCSSVHALECETWAGIGAGSRDDESHFRGRGFELGEIEVEIDGEEVEEDIISDDDFSFSSNETYSIFNGWAKTRGDNAYFKVYSVYGELRDRSLNNLWVGMGYYIDQFCYRMAVIPNFGYTCHTHHLMDVYSYWVGLDLHYRLTNKWSVWGEFGYHFAHFRKKKRAPFSFERRKGHAVTSRIGTDFHLYGGWFMGLSMDYQDWKSSDSHRVQWCIRDFSGHLGYYF